MCEPNNISGPQMNRVPTVDYSFNEFVIIYSLHFVCHYLVGGIYKIKKKNSILDLQIYRIYKSKDSIRKINNSLKILRNKPNIIISYSYESY